MLSLVTAVFSALLDNVTTVLLIVPVTLLITEELEVRPYPYLVSEILFSNIGGTATLIGASANLVVAGFSERAGHPIRFVAFFKSCFLVMILSIAISHVYISLRYL